ncbi:MAG: hypothetical protein Wins2KO_32000 [Winogradskyella sp.]
MSKEENKYLSTTGLTFPTCEEELLAYDKQHENVVYELNENVIDPFKIAKEFEVEEAYKKKILNKSQSYFRRAVLAAKITDEYHNEWTFGIVKFQKLVYLAEQISKMKFAADYRKQAAGPMNHKFIHSIKKEFEKQGWFTVHKQEGKYQKWIFTPQARLKNYESYYSQYFFDANEDIQFLIDSFRKWKTDKVELIATVFACWLEAKEENSLINDALLTQKVYAWHKAKKKFSKKDIIESIRWMKDNGVYPK